MKLSVWLLLVCTSWLVLAGGIRLAGLAWSDARPVSSRLLTASAFTGIVYPPTDQAPRHPAQTVKALSGATAAFPQRARVQGI